MLANPRHPRGLAVLARRGAAQAARALGWGAHAR
jgi:hypothetical protein